MLSPWIEARFGRVFAMGRPLQPRLPSHHLSPGATLAHWIFEEERALLGQGTAICNGIRRGRARLAEGLCAPKAAGVWPSSNTNGPPRRRSPGDCCAKRPVRRRLLPRKEAPPSRGDPAGPSSSRWWVSRRERGCPRRGSAGHPPLICEALYIAAIGIGSRGEPINSSRTRPRPGRRSRWRGRSRHGSQSRAAQS